MTRSKYQQQMEQELQEEEEVMLFGEALAILHRQADIIFELVQGKPQKVIQVLIRNINNQNFIIMPPLQLIAGMNAPILEQLVDATDPANLKPIAGATKVPKSKAFDNPSAASVDASGNLVAMPGVTAKGNLTDINTWTWIDPQGKSQTQDVATVIEVDIAPAVAQQVVQQIVTLGAAVPNAAGQAAAVHTGPAR
jgi:hypothetical protein